MAGELAVLRLAQPDEEVQAVEEQPAVLQTEGGREQALLGLVDPVAVAVRVQFVRVEVVVVVEDIGYVTVVVVVVVELDVVDEVLAVVATAAAAAAAVVV